MNYSIITIDIMFISIQIGTFNLDNKLKNLDLYNWCPKRIPGQIIICYFEDNML